jgi:hypothetical protein
MKICTEQDCLRAHLTLIKKAPRGLDPILRKLKQSFASMLTTVRFCREKPSADQRIMIQPLVPLVILKVPTLKLLKKHSLSL